MSCIKKRELVCMVKQPTFEQRGYFGKSSKPRELDPSMFELLRWELPIEDPVTFKNNERVLPIGHKEPCCHHINQANNVPCCQNSQIQKDTCNYVQTPISTNNQPLNKKQPQKIMRRTSSAHQNRTNIHQNRGSRMEKENKIRNQSQTKKEKRNMNEKQVLNPSQEQERALEKFRQTTRWLPNSSFTTYFGKPAFENYGRGNLTPVNGGLVYGNYLKTHNVQPHRGSNKPKNMQCYQIALSKGKMMGRITPQPPKSKPIGQQKSSLALQEIYPKSNNQNSLEISAPNLYEIQKFGGSGLPKQNRSKMFR